MNHRKIQLGFIKGIPLKPYRCGPGCPLQQVRSHKKAWQLRCVTTPLQMIWKRNGSRTDFKSAPCPSPLLRRGGRDLPCTLSRSWMSRSGQWLHRRGQDWMGCPQWKIRSMAPVLYTVMSTGEFGLDPNLIKSINVFWLTAAVFEKAPNAYRNFHLNFYMYIDFFDFFFFVDQPAWLRHNTELCKFKFDLLCRPVFER